MARLNEPVSMDNIETFRRKFLRQNRDIARINSAQSLRIRSLENECARLLSENLDLRGQVLRLEKEAEENSSHRIADHALEIKAKMEAHLLEWSSLLSGLGLEPPRKRQSIERKRKSAQHRTSLSRNSPLCRPRNPTRNIDAVAMQEGRLPPIHEHKSYPRQTLNREEILALCPEAEDSTNSPDLGPPPVSRFVDEDPIKRDSPPRPAEYRVFTDTRPVDLILEPPQQPGVSSDIVAPKKKHLVEPTPKKDVQTLSATSKADPTPPPPIASTSKPSSKRKFATSDENEARKAEAGIDSLKSMKGMTDKSAAPRDVKGKRSIKELSAARREAREKSLAGPTVAPRQPLATKSTNESPRKLVTSNGSGSVDDGNLIKQVAGKESKPKEKSDLKPKEKSKEAHSTPVLEVKIPTELPKAPETATIPEPEDFPPPIDSRPLSPDTPARLAASRGHSCDTPPPKDVSTGGDMGRAGRRVRAAISYAEPNLRDKMRRPTKQLFDAVAGEGKFKHRASISTHKDDAAPASATKSTSGETSTGKPSSIREPSGREGAISPLTHRTTTPTPSDLPQSIVTNRRKRSSSIGGGRDDSVSGQTEQNGRSVTTKDTVVVKEEKDQEERVVDPYDFTESSPAEAADSKAGSTAGAVRGSSGAQRGVGTKSSSSRRAHHPASSSADDDDEYYVPPSRQHIKSSKSAAVASSGGRKRASLAVPKNPSMLAAVDSDDDYFDTSSRSGGSGGGDAADQDQQLSARDRISRRRSMML